MNQRNGKYGLEYSTMRLLWQRLVPLVVIAALTATNVSAQSTADHGAAEKVRAKIAHLAANAPISVVRIHADEQYGNFLSADNDTFTFYDIDAKAKETVRFDEVRKVKSGYGGYDSARGRHTDHTKAIVIGVIAVGSLAAVVIAASLAK